MIVDYFFQHVKTPVQWKFIGWNNVKDNNLETGEDEILSYGKVFDDRVGKYIRISFTLGSESLGITERFLLNGKQKYKTVCDCRSVEIDQFNDYIFKNY